MAKLSYKVQLELVYHSLRLKALEMEAQANRDLDDLVRLMNLRADYEWFRDRVLTVMPLGIQRHHDVTLIRWWARRDGMGHIVDALIDELSLKGAGIELARLK